MSRDKQLGVVIVNYRTADLTIRCVESIIQHGIATSQQITVVDNLSPDDSVAVISQALPNISLVASDTNAGFGAGVNIGVRESDGDVLLILNPDTYFEMDSVTPALALIEADPKIGLLGLDLVYPDHTRQYSSRRFYSVLDIVARRLGVGTVWPFTRVVDRHLMRSAWVSSEPFDAEWVMGTGFLIPRAVYEEVGGMDEAYFLYMEDVDLCARVWRAGYRVVCAPGAQLVHDHQRSSAASPLSRAGRAHMHSLLRFRKKFALPFLRPPGINRVIHAQRRGGW
ncbi:glycosyltransferase family 2 protein [Brevundimonas sp. SL130]|uniref:glycosyltransferase family 2 protein n=1 Tax=Brevundimonas sp. SL130 TaxID=2995143 RepID=UPI00226C7B58|nr:glycosyltransferase family 2 protein [Brevundimonas sp. SL130]WAC59877.1 glycosyltransferase family 2 protein [Brevundimonas sp. SL130]